MPATKYHCAYCDKAFVYSAAARRKHVELPNHQSNKKAWFDSFRDPAELLAENPSRGICAQFMRSGSCPFGFTCKYIHPPRPVQEAPGRLHRSGQPRNDLPPSLQLPPEGGYPSSAFPAVEWG